MAQASEVARAEVERYGPGEAASPDELVPGDFILTHGSAWTSKLIRIGQRIRFHGDDRKFTWWNHTAMVVSADGGLVEALGAGVESTNLSKYHATEYHLVKIDASAEDRDEVVRFANWCLGESYGFLTIFSIAVGLLTGAKFTFAFDGQTICSGLVARSLERTAAIFDRTPSHIMPADLAKYFKVEPPPPDTPTGKAPGA